MSDGKSKCAQHAQLACAVFTHNFGDLGFGGSPINPKDHAS